MLLQQVNIIGTTHLSNIEIRDGKIARIDSGAAAQDQCVMPGLRFGRAIAFPGIINSHDHLDFNLFPRLGNRIYNNYTEWGKDIHAVNREAIKRVARIPVGLRARWGMYKNLINGITTVVNHGKKLSLGNELISVLQGCRDLHSPAFEKNWKWKINFSMGRRQPIVIHAGEGKDEPAAREIDRLIRWNFFKKKIIVVHGVAMSPAQARSFAALIWCPDSNFFLLNKTAPIGLLHDLLPVMLGTDSTLTTRWNFWEQLRLARSQNQVTDSRLMDMLGSIPARAWNLDYGGHLLPGGRADLVIATAREGVSGLDRFYELNPRDLLLVMHKGNIRLFDESLSAGSAGHGLPASGFSRITVQGTGKYIAGDLPALMDEIRRYDPEIRFPVTPG